MTPNLHLIIEPLCPFPCITECDPRCGIKEWIKLIHGCQLMSLVSNVNVELSDSIKCQLITLHKELEGMAHEGFCPLDCIRRHRGRHHDHLSRGRDASDYL